VAWLSLAYWHLELNRGHRAEIIGTDSSARNAIADIAAHQRPSGQSDVELLVKPLRDRVCCVM
jgi:hypothetical protein